MKAFLVSYKPSAFRVLFVVRLYSSARFLTIQSPPGLTVETEKEHFRNQIHVLHIFLVSLQGSILKFQSFFFIGSLFSEL